MARCHLLSHANTRWFAAFLTLAGCGAPSEPSEDFAPTPEELRLPNPFTPLWWHRDEHHSLCPFVSVGATPQTAATIGERVEIEASAKCWQHAIPEYLIWYRPPESSWRVLRQYAAESSYDWNTANAAPGAHVFRVWARARGSHAWFQAASDLTYRLLARCQAPSVSFAPSVAAPGSDVTISAPTTCGSEPEYEFRVRAVGSSDTPWTVLQTWSVSESAVWRTSGLALGDYEIQVGARNQGSGADTQAVAVSTYHLQAICGDGRIDGVEACDSQNVGSATCATATAGGKPLGTLACDPSCRLDTTQCSTPQPPGCLQLSYLIPTTVTTITRHGGMDTASWCDPLPTYSTRSSSYQSEISLTFANGIWNAVNAAQSSPLAMVSDGMYRASFYGAVQSFEVNCGLRTASLRGQMPETRIGMCDHVSEVIEGVLNFGEPGAGGSGGSGSLGAGGTSGSGGTFAGGSPGSGGAVGSGGVAGGTGGQASCPREGGEMLRLPEGYCIDRTEVTFAQYTAWLATSPPVPDATDPNCGWQRNAPLGPWSPGEAMRPEHPVSAVNWCDAAGYCSSFGKRLCGKIGGGALDGADADNPLLSEWLNACTAHGQYVFPYGNTYNSTFCAESVTPVGSRTQCQSPDAAYAGVFDLVANVAEWDDSCTEDFCFARGGAVGLNAPGFACSVRMGFGGDNPHAIAFPLVGFRCCAP